MPRSGASRRGPYSTEWRSRFERRTIAVAFSQEENLCDRMILCSNYWQDN